MKAACVYDPEPAVGPGSGIQEKIYSMSCSQWLNLLKSWNLRQSPGGSEASKHVALECLSISPNCGLSGGAAKTWVDEDKQKRKLVAVVDTAERIWGSV